MLELKITGREQSSTSMYFVLTYDAYARYDSDMREAARYLHASRGESGSRTLDLWKKHCEGAMRYFLVQHLYAAICLEAFIYDYAASNLGDRYVQKYLDKLDLISKWVVIPRLVLGREVPRDGQAFEYLTLIKRERDKLAHSKSRPQLTDEERQRELAAYEIDSFQVSAGVRPNLHKHTNVFWQLTYILNVLKELEVDSGHAQEWWGIEEVPG